MPKSASWGVYLVLGGVLSPGGSDCGGVWFHRGGSALGGVCSQGVSALGGVSVPGGVVSQHALRQTPGNNRLVPPLPQGNPGTATGQDSRPCPLPLSPSRKDGTLPYPISGSATGRLTSDLLSSTLAINI